MQPFTQQLALRSLVVGVGWRAVFFGCTTVSTDNASFAMAGSLGPNLLGVVLVAPPLVLHLCSVPHLR